MIVFLIFSLVCAISYFILIIGVVKAWKRIPEFKRDEGFSGNTLISILIPARNEEKNISKLLSCIDNQNYPKELFEVIVIDDHSEDGTPEIVKSFPAGNISLISLSEYVDENATGSFKKAAIETAMKFAKGDLIIQTDADCEMGKEWLSSIADFHARTGYKMIAAPVNFHKEKSLLEKFQSLDFTGMMGVTGAGIELGFMRMCNGANLAYEKRVFKEVNGFEGNEDKASGDDMFLLHKIAEKYPDKIGFLKSLEAVVFTEAKPTLKTFFSQRLRWATKNAAYDDFRVLAVNALVFFTCFAFFTSLIFLPFNPLIFGITALGIIIIKGIADFYFLNITSSYFNRKDLMKIFIPAQFMHTAYIFVIGMAANFVGSYEWKGRKVR